MPKNLGKDIESKFNLSQPVRRCVMRQSNSQVFAGLQVICYAVPIAPHDCKIGFLCSSVETSTHR